MLMNGVRIFRFDITRQVFRRHRPELRAAEEIRPGPLKMAPANSPQFPGRLFTHEGDFEVSASQAAIPGKEEPGAEAREISEGEEEPQRKPARDCRARAVQKVDAEIEHAQWHRSGRIWAEA